MIATTQQFNSVIKKIQGIILKEEKLSETRRLILELYTATHPGKSTGTSSLTMEDEIWSGCKDDAFRIIPGRSICSAAWHLWHTARIEDIVTSYLILREKQIFITENYRKKLKVPFYDTGNGMNRAMMEKFNATIDLKALHSYRSDIAARGFALLKGISLDTIKTKVKAEDIRQIGDEGNIDNESIWLLDFWGRKRISGLITLPLTRHHLMHHNSAKKILFR